MVTSARKPSQKASKVRKKTSSPSSKAQGGRHSTRKSIRQDPTGNPLLLELGTEELPASFVEPALSKLAFLLEKMLNEQRLTFESVQTMGTPRRLTVMVAGLIGKQAALSQEVMGPPQSVAYDAQGTPTKAAQGFASTQGVPVEALQIRETPKGIYVCAVKHETGRSTTVVLKEQLPKVIQDLSFKKSMKWNDSKLRFARPLRWMVALYGQRTLRFEVAGVSSGSRTFGHRFLGRSGGTKNQGTAVTNPSSYIAALKRVGVMVDPQERRTLIRSQVQLLARSVNGKVYGENYEELLEQAVYTVECPHAILGSFDKEFLTLPQEVLITAMKEHQGFFSLIGRKGALLPKFVTVTNMKLPKMDLIRQGNERVLTARLSDAQYFFREDRKVTLADRVEQLQGITFHQKLGSIYQKVTRLQELVPRIAEFGGRADMKNICERAANLAKSDLTTGLVGEFPTLQGIMGREYAKHDGESQEVCEALGELYLPGTPEGELPKTSAGIFLGLGDRLDTLTAFFRVGMVPSGSEDPFALRRIGYGLVRTIVEKGLRLNLAHLISNAEQILQSQGVGGKQTDSIGTILIEFLLERLRFFAKTVHGIREDLIEATLATRASESCDLTDLLARMQALQLVTTLPEFSPLIIGYKRVNRIIDKEQWRERSVRPELFEHEAEKQLYKAVGDTQPLMVTFLAQQNYRDALAKLLDLKNPIDEFFEGVMVNAQDQQVRANRLSLLGIIDQLFLSVADFSRIQGSPN